ncbi:MAG: hypothetical protein LWW97_09075 [Deltaproteobacteria bacterium]|nr:hypothetical protein [Deltaproteobacteria bacterium]
MEIQKVYIDRDNTAVIVCHHCGFSKRVNVIKFKGRKDPVTIRCKCQSASRVLFEFRTAYRKTIYIEGMYSKLPACKDWGRMVVKNISMTGIGFAALIMHDLKKGNKVKVKFTLDDKSRSDVEKDAVVEVVENNYLGCKFTVPVGFENKALGFYLMS